MKRELKAVLKVESVGGNQSFAKIGAIRYFDFSIFDFRFSILDFSIFSLPISAAFCSFSSAFSSARPVT